MQTEREGWALGALTALPGDSYLLHNHLLTPNLGDLMPSSSSMELQTHGALTYIQEKHSHTQISKKNMFFRSLVSLYVFSLSLHFGGEGRWSQGFAHTRQVLSHWTSLLVLILFYLRDRVCVCVYLCLSVFEPHACNTCRSQEMTWKIPWTRTTSHCEPLYRYKYTNC